MEKKRKPIFKSDKFHYLPGMEESGDQLDFNFAADDLLELPRDLGEEGWFQYRSEQRQAIQVLEEKFGVVLNKRVRLRLFGWEEEFEGKLVVDTLLPAQSGEGLPLRLGRMKFTHNDIAFCSVLD